MAFAEVGSGSQRSSANSAGTAIPALSIDYPGDVTAGNLLIAVMAWWRTSPGANGSPTCEDDVGTTFSSIVSDQITLGSGAYRLAIFYGAAGGSGANTIAMSDAVANSFMSGSINEFSGQHATPLSVSSTTPNTGTSTDPTASLTTLTSGELVIGVMSHGNGANPTMAVDAPSTQFGEEETQDADQGHSAGFRIGGAAGSHAIDWTLGASSDWATLIASFEAAEGVSGTLGYLRSNQLRPRIFAPGLAR